MVRICCSNQTTRHNIKRPVCPLIAEARKTFKVVFLRKTQSTPLSLFAGVMILLMLSAPFLAVAQQANPAAIRAANDGEGEAVKRTSRLTWFTLGVVGGPITVFLAARKPPPPAELFLGKAPGYVDAFTEAYETKARSLRFKYATIGCFAGLAAVTLGYTVYDEQQHGNWWWETW